MLWLTGDTLYCGGLSSFRTIRRYRSGGMGMKAADRALVERLVQSSEAGTVQWRVSGRDGYYASRGEASFTYTPAERRLSVWVSGRYEVTLDRAATEALSRAAAASVERDRTANILEMTDAARSRGARRRPAPAAAADLAEACEGFVVALQARTAAGHLSWRRDLTEAESFSLSVGQRSLRLTPAGGLVIADSHREANLDGLRVAPASEVASLLRAVRRQFALRTVEAGIASLG